MLIIFGLIILFVLADSIRGYLTAKNKKRYLIQLSVGLPIVTLLFFLFGPFFALSPIKLGYSSFIEGNLVVYYPSSQAEMGKKVFEMAQQATQINNRFYQTQIGFPVVVVTSEFDMLRFGAPPQAGGSGNELAINIRAQRASWNIIAHEMSHRNLRSVINKTTFSLPKWFDEGLASYLGKMDYYKKEGDLKVDLETDRYRQDMPTWNGFLGNLRWMWTVFREKGGSKQLYGQAYLMTKYLFDKYEEEKVYQFALALKKNSFDDAFLQTFGLTQEQFHQDFINYIRNS